MVAHLVANASMTVVRDTESLAVLSSLPGLEDRALLGTDFTLGLDARDLPDTDIAWAADFVKDLPGPTLGINLIEINCHAETVSDPDVIGTIRNQVLDLCQAHDIRSVVVLSNSANMTEAAASIAFMDALDLGEPMIRVIVHRRVWQTLAVISKLDLLITMKLHFAIAAYALEVPVACIGYHPKCRRFFDEIDKLAYYESVTDFGSQSRVLRHLFEGWLRFYDQDDVRSRIRERLTTTHSMLDDGRQREQGQSPRELQ